MQELDNNNIIKIKNSNISRRDAIKFATLTTASSFILPTKISASNDKIDKAKTDMKIVIIGGGFSGVALSYKIANIFKNPNITIIEPNKKSISYQPYQLFVATGLAFVGDMYYNTQDYLSHNLKWVQDEVIHIVADNRYILLSSGSKIRYDCLVVASGVVLDYSKIKGLEEVGAIYSTRDNKKASRYLKNIGVNSIYFSDGAKEAQNSINNFITKNKNGDRLSAIFTEPNTPIKSLATTKSLIFLIESRLKKMGNKTRANAKFHLYTAKNSMLLDSKYNASITKHFKDKNIKWSYLSDLKEIDYKNKIAIFNRSWIEKGIWNDKLKTHQDIIKYDKLKTPYDFIHVTPPMRASDSIINSGLCGDNGFVSVNKKTLQHKKYDNIFALGDVANIDTDKTIQSAIRQCEVVSQNILSLSKNIKLNAKYDGYTSSFISVSLGSSIFAKFNWQQKSISSLTLDTKKDRWLWWIAQRYFKKPITMYGLLPDRI